MAEDKLAADVMRRLETLKGNRGPHEDTWRECFDLSFPHRADGWNGVGQTVEGVSGKRSKLYNSVSTDAGRILASGIQSGMTPANSRWFGMSAWNESDEEKRWFDDSATTLWEAIHASNFDADSYECMLDIVAAGWFVLFCDIDQEEDGTVNGFQFEQWPISSCYCSASKKGGQIDTIYRPYQLTVEQCVTEFGLDQVPQRVRDMWTQEKMDEKIDLVHAIYPRDKPMPGARRSRNLPFASIHIDVTARKVVRESGYHEQPFTAPRWTVIPRSVYAVGPMLDALPDIRTLNKFEELELANADIAVAGMWIAEDDGVLNPRTVKVGARKIIIANSTESMKPLTSGADFNISFMKRGELVASIRKILMADQLQPQDGPAMTATEVNVRVQLIRQLLGPVYGRLQAEYLKTLIQRCFGLAFRAGLFEEPPQSLAGRPYTVVYTSPLAKSQKMEEVVAIEGTVAAIGAMAQAKGDPTIWDNVDTDEATRLMGEGRGAPAKVIRTAEDVAAIRKTRQEQQEAQQQQAMQQQVAAEAASATIQRTAEAA